MRGWFGCVIGRSGFSSLQEEKGQVESSTVILTFPLISSSVVPVLSGFCVFVGAVQCQLTWTCESRAAGGCGRPIGDGRNERRRRPHLKRSHQARRGLCQDTVGHVGWDEWGEAGVEAWVVLVSTRSSRRERVGKRVKLIQVRGSSSVRGAGQVRARREVQVH